MIPIGGTSITRIARFNARWPSFGVLLATALHIASELRERVPDVAVTRLASGLPVGADLEYADELTLGRALAGRRAV